MMNASYLKALAGLPLSHKATHLSLELLMGTNANFCYEAVPSRLIEIKFRFGRFKPLALLC